MHHKEPKPSLPLSCCVPGHEDICIQGKEITSFHTQTCYMPLKNDLSLVVNIAAWILMVASFFMASSFFLKIEGSHCLHSYFKKTPT